MDGRTAIINQALLYMGEDTIINPDSESKNAKLCAQVYDSTLTELLSGHPWSFSLMAARLQLAQEEPRDFRFRYAYQLPTNFGRLQNSMSGIRSDFDPWQENMLGRELNLQGADISNSIPIPEYMVQGDKMYSNFRDLQIIYTRTDVQPFEMSPQFRNYFAASIAMRLYTKVTGGTDGLAALQKLVAQIQLEAKHTDGEQMDTMPANRPNLFIRSRLY